MIQILVELVCSIDTLSFSLPDLSDSLVGTTLGSPEDISSEPSVQNLKIKAFRIQPVPVLSSNEAAGTGSLENDSPFYQLRKEVTMLTDIR